MTGFHVARLIVGESPEIRALREEVIRLAPKNLPVLIHGPSGTGKELVAEALHRASGRPGDFVAFNVCAIADTMFEDALFGHTRGAFTGATGDAMGLLGEADRGTAFLDEVSGLSLANQAKLLRVLETHRFRPIGAPRDRASDFRAIAATNDDLWGLVKRRAFREDLAYRLTGAVVRVPALREHPEDIPPLVRHFLERIDPTRTVTLTQAALDTLSGHDWPGNVRELRQTLERALVFATAARLTSDDVVLALARARAEPAAYLTAREELITVLDAVGWHAERAAAALGVHKVTVYRRMRRFGIELPRTHGWRRARGSNGGADTAD